MLIKEYGKTKGRILRALGYEPDRNLDPKSNGEYRLMSLLASLPEIQQYDCIVDVGANKGDWTAEAIARLGERLNGNFFCVEPIPGYARNIRSRFSYQQNVSVIENVLSNESGGTVEIFEAGEGGSLYRSYRGNEPSQAAGGKRIVPHQVEKITGDDLFMPMKHKPYLIKIDCDGHDLIVLQGLNEVLSKLRPIVQFEYCDFWIGSKSRLKSACAMLRKHGYATFKSFPDRLVRFNFNPMFETFGYQNIIAAPKELQSFQRNTIPLPV